MFSYLPHDIKPLKETNIRSKKKRDWSVAPSWRGRPQLPDQRKPSKSSTAGSLGGISQRKLSFTSQRWQASCSALRAFLFLDRVILGRVPQATLRTRRKKWWWSQKCGTKRWSLDCQSGTAEGKLCHTATHSFMFSLQLFHLFFLIYLFKFWTIFLISLHSPKWSSSFVSSFKLTLFLSFWWTKSRLTSTSHIQPLKSKFKSKTQKKTLNVRNMIWTVYWLIRCS